MERGMDLGPWNILVGMFIRVNGNRAREKEMELRHSPMVTSMKEVGLLIKSMGLGNINGLTAQNMKEILQTLSGMAMGI